MSTKSKARRCAQTALYRLTYALVRLLAPLAPATPVRRPEGLSGQIQIAGSTTVQPLAEVLGEAILVPYIVRNETGDIVALGRVGGRAQTLPVGTYEIEVRTVPAVTFEMVEIIEREVVQLTLDE